MAKLLIIGKDYYPDKLGVSKYTTEMAEWLASKSYDVEVITGHPYYPEWRYKGKRSPNIYYKEVINKVSLLRVPLFIPKRASGIWRSIQNISFALFSFPLILYNYIIKRPSNVITLVPSYTNSIISVICGKIFRIKTIIHVQDLEFDLAEKLNLLPSSLCKMLFYIESFTLTHSSIISSISLLLGQISFK